MEVYSSDYMKLFVHEQYSLLEEVWFETSRGMTNDDFKQEMLFILKIIKTNNVKYHLVDLESFLFVLTLDLQKWILKNFIIPSVRHSLEKTAFVVSDDLFSQMSIELAVEEDSKGSFKREYFTNKAKAFHWLINDQS